MQQLRVGLVGAGLVGQAEHAFYLWEERHRFIFSALVDPSASVRAEVGDRYGVEKLYADFSEIVPTNLDAVVIAAPDAFHPAIAIRALESGLHVMCEKPLALTVEGCERIISARDLSGRVAQVAYMKRYDPAYRQALEFLPKNIEDVKLISVEVNDPDHEPFVSHLPMTWPADIPAKLRELARTQAGEQLRNAAQRPLEESSARALGGGFLSALVHDVAVVHGMLLHLGCDLPGEADQGAFFDGGRGVQLAFGLPGGGRVAMMHVNLPGVPDYSERITVYCTDRIIELLFPSPYLRHIPTRLRVKRAGERHALVVSEYRASYEEAFREELRAFHSAATGARPVETPLEQARDDVRLLTSAFRKALA